MVRRKSNKNHGNYWRSCGFSSGFGRKQVLIYNIIGQTAIYRTVKDATIRIRRYQDVLDGMSEEEMARAEEINRQREEEYRIHEQTKQYRIYDTESNMQSIGSEGSFICENIYLREGQVVPPVVAVVPFKVEEAVPVPVAIGQECMCTRIDYNINTYHTIYLIRTYSTYILMHIFIACIHTSYLHNTYIHTYIYIHT